MTNVLQQAWADWVGKRSDLLDTRHNENIFKAGFEAALAQQGEPVAIAECKVVHGQMCQFLNRTPHGMKTLKDGDKLYAGAAPAAQPLTDEQIDELRFSVTAQHHTERARKLVRLVERHHGIGVDK